MLDWRNWQTHSTQNATDSILIGSNPISSTIIRQIRKITVLIYTTPSAPVGRKFEYSPIEVRQVDLAVDWCSVSINQKHYGEGSIRINIYEQPKGWLCGRVKELTPTQHTLFEAYSVYVD